MYAGAFVWCGGQASTAGLWESHLSDTSQVDTQLKLMCASGSVAAYFRRDAAFDTPFHVSDVCRAASTLEQTEQHALSNAEMAQLLALVACRDSTAPVATIAPTSLPL